MNRIVAVIAFLWVSTALLEAQPSAAPQAVSFIEVDYHGKQDSPVFPLIISDSERGAGMGAKKLSGPGSRHWNGASMFT